MLAFTITITFTLLAVFPAQSAAAQPLSSGIDPANFDTSVRPQDDLFRAVNGTWLAKTEIPADRADYGAFAVLAEQAEKDMLAIIEELRQCQGRGRRLREEEDRRPVRRVHGRTAGRAAWHRAHRRHARLDRPDRDQGRPRAVLAELGAPGCPACSTSTSVPMPNSPIGTSSICPRQV